MPSVSYENVHTVYIGNDPNTLLAGKETSGVVTTEHIWAQETGWHIIPCQLYQNWMTPAQWFDLVTNHSAFRLASVHVTVQNMIPLTDNLSISQETTFVSFNNTIYALGYVDSQYNTNPQEDRLPVEWREGITYKQTENVPTVDGIIGLPKYTHFLPMKPQGTTPETYKPLARFAWDPFIHASALMELRPGKNAIEFGWSRNSSDDDQWCSTRSLWSLSNTGDRSNKPFFSESFNYAYNSAWMTPGQLLKEYPGHNINPYTRTARLLYNRTWHHPLTQFFVKLMPIFSTKAQQLKHSAQVVLVRKITFDVQPRKSCVNWPQLQDIDFKDYWNKLPTAGGHNYTMSFAPPETQYYPPMQVDMDTKKLPFRPMDLEPNPTAAERQKEEASKIVQPKT